MKSFPKVVIVGRMNVGKSTLFNRLSCKVKSLTLDHEGVTRDFLTDSVSWCGKTFELVDTGGIEHKKHNDPFSEIVRKKSLDVIDQASVILFMVDGAVGSTQEDETISRILKKHNQKVVLLVNKSDVKEAQENMVDFYKFGFNSVILISAQHGRAIADVLEKIVELVPDFKEEDVEKYAFKVAFLGKPNVGKSSLMNLLLNKERSLVSEIAGTTREAISDKIHFYQEAIMVTDTAGVRRSAVIDEDIEEMMVKTSLQAVRNADIVVLLVDAKEGALSAQELKLAAFVFENGKALILVKNKHDLLNEDIQELWKSADEYYDFLLKKIEKITISCKTGHNVGKLMPLIKDLWQRYSTSFSSTELTLLFKESLDHTSLFKGGHRLKVFSARQVVIHPPTIRLNVNKSEWFEDSTLAFFENVMRKKYNMQGIPLKFVARTIIPK